MTETQLPQAMDNDRFKLAKLTKRNLFCQLRTADILDFPNRSVLQGRAECAPASGIHCDKLEDLVWGLKKGIP